MNSPQRQIQRSTTLQTAGQLQHCHLDAVDGKIGTVEDFYIEDTTWCVRYLLVKISNPGRYLHKHVLVHPLAIGESDDDSIDVELTRKQVHTSPGVHVHQQITRQDEAHYFQFYNWTPYWESATPPFVSSAHGRYSHTNHFDNSMGEGQSTYVHKLTPFLHLGVDAIDGEAGQLLDFIVDTRYWMLRYLVLYLEHLHSGKHRLVSVDMIQGVDWLQHHLALGLRHEEIIKAPVYDPSLPISRQYEMELFRYYGQAVYWRSDFSLH